MPDPVVCYACQQWLQSRYINSYIHGCDTKHLSVFISQFFCETEDGIGQSDPAWEPWDTLGHL